MGGSHSENEWNEGLLGIRHKACVFRIDLNNWRVEFGRFALDFDDFII